MFDFDEIENIKTEDDDLVEEGGVEIEEEKKKEEDAEDWGLEEDLKDEGN